MTPPDPAAPTREEIDRLKDALDSANQDLIEIEHVWRNDPYATGPKLAEQILATRKRLCHAIAGGSPERAGPGGSMSDPNSALRDDYDGTWEMLEQANGEIAELRDVIESLKTAHAAELARVREEIEAIDAAVREHLCEEDRDGIESEAKYVLLGEDGEPILEADDIPGAIGAAADGWFQMSELVGAGDALSRDLLKIVEDNMGQPWIVPVAEALSRYEKIRWPFLRPAPGPGGTG